MQHLWVILLAHKNRHAHVTTKGALSVIGQVMFNNVSILHRAVDEMPRADFGAAEQEVGEHLLVLVPVQSCFTHSLTTHLLCLLKVLPLPPQCGRHKWKPPNPKPIFCHFRKFSTVYRSTNASLETG